MPGNTPNFGSEDFLPLAHPQALTDPEKLIAAYFSASTVGLSILDSELRYLAINDALAAMNGRSVSDHLGKTVREILGDFADVVEPKLRRVLETAQPVDFEASVRLPGRAEVSHWMLHYLPIQDASGIVTRIGVLVVERAVQKKLEKSLQDVGGKLRKETERLQMLLDVTSLLSSNWNVQQVFPSVSARIRRVLLQEYAGFELHDHNTGLLVRQVEDFPLGKGLLSAVQISTSNSPGGLSLRERAPLIFTKHQMQRLRLPGTFWQKDFNRFVACRFSDPKRRWGFLCSAAPAWTLFSRTISPC